MGRKGVAVLMAVVALNLVFSGFVLGRSTAGRGDGGSKVYTLYVGMNDKDAYRPLVTEEEARTRLNAVAMQHADGFTVFSARGYWKDGKGEPTSEDTLVYRFADATERQITVIMDEMLSAMNQNSILLEVETAERIFYSGGASLFLPLR